MKALIRQALRQNYWSQLIRPRRDIIHYRRDLLEQGQAALEGNNRSRALLM